MLRALACALFLSFAVVQPQALAQPWPAKPVRLVVPFPPGGGVDLTGRVLGKRLGEIWAQPVVVENRPGAAATIGANVVATAPADGYTLLLTNNALSISAGLYPTLPYDTLKDLRAVSTVLSTPFVFVVPAAEKAKDVGEFIRAAQAKPDGMSYASTGIGSGPHLAMVLLQQMTGTRMNHIPYKGGGQALTDLIAGRVQALLTTPLAAMPHVQAGKVRALGVSGSTRMAQFPNLPTLAESGVPGYGVETWYMVLAPARTPQDLVERMQKDIAAAVKDPAVVKSMETEGATLIGSTPAQAQELVARDIARWTEVIKKAGITPAD